MFIFAVLDNSRYTHNDQTNDQIKNLLFAVLLRSVFVVWLFSFAQIMMQHTTRNGQNTPIYINICISFHQNIISKYQSEKRAKNGKNAPQMLINC